MTVPLRAWRACASCCFALVVSAPGQADNTTAPATGGTTGLPRPPAFAPELLDQALARWRAGSLPAAGLLQSIDAWLAQATNAGQRARLEADRIVVASQAGLHEKAVAFARARGADALPAYALLPLIASARAVGDREIHAAAVQRLRMLEPGGFAPRVQEVLLLSDQGRLADAQARLDALAAGASAAADEQVAIAELRGALAEAQGDRTGALRHYQHVLALSPKHRYARRAGVLLTAGLGAPSAALGNALAAEPGLFSALEIAGLRQAALGEHLRWAVRERDLQPALPERFAALDKVIADGAALAREPQANAPQAAADHKEAAAWRAIQARLAADRVVAQFERGDAHGTLALYDDLRLQHGEPPYFAKAAAAGAHARLRRPDLAVPLYEAALQQGGDAVRVPSDIHVGLVYAYLDTARFAQADALVDQMLARTPPLLALSPEAGRANDDYGDLLGLRALVALYTDRPQQAERDFAALVARAPLNTGYRTGEARALRLRQHPQAALAAFEALLTDVPDSAEVQAGHAEALLDAGHLQAGRERIDALALSHPEHAAVRSAVRMRDAILAPRLDVDAGTGRDGGTLANRDSRIDTRLSSGWTQDQVRFFAHSWIGTADVGATRPRHARTGAGIEWLQGPWRLEGELHHASSGPRRAGVSLAADWRASDAWRLAARADSNSVDVPWRARSAGIAAADAEIQVRHVAHESRTFWVRLQHRGYTDGNRRSSAGAGWQERWFSGPRLQLQTTLAGDTARNTLAGAPYFSPAREQAVALTGRAQWLTWKRDDRTFVQVVEASAGRYAQAGFATGATSALRYAHEWAWGPGRSLRYGLGTSMHPYDGVREHRREAFVQLSMPLP